MTKTTTYNPSSAEKELMERALRIEKQYYDPKMNRKDIIWRKRNLADLESHSQVEPCTLLWNNLSVGAQTKWNNAGAVCGLTGWQLFLQDTTYRLLNEIPGLASPSVKHQYKVFEFVTGDACNEFYIWQDHPASYTIKQKNVGQKNAYTPVDITETISAPLLLEFNYFADLEWDGTPEFWGVFVEFTGTKSGSPATDYIWFDLDIITGWKAFSESLSPDLDTITSYYVEFDAYPVKGTFRFDVVNLYHDSQNWAFDPNCDIISEKIIDYGSGWDYPWQLDWSGTYQSVGSVYI